MKKSLDPAEWMKKADSDLRTAEAALEKDPPGLADTICHLCQQAAEKYLKALLISRGWALKKTHDLEMAGKNIAIGGYDIAAFLSHQAVEKLLKSIFALKGRKIPRTHYIDEMARNLKLNAGVCERVRDLTADYTLSRYPDVADGAPYEMYTRTIAEEKVKRAREIFSSLRRLTKELSEGGDV